MSGTKNTLRRAPSTKRRIQAGISIQSAAKRRRDELVEVSQDNRKCNCDFTPSVVLSYGTGDAGQLGLGEDIFEKKRPCLIPNLRNVIKISSGGMHTICLNDKAEVFTFGCNDEGALGRICKDDSESSEPGLVNFPEGVKIKDITAGDSHSSALSDDGVLYVWGGFRDNNGIIGLIKPDEKVLTPVSLKIEKPIVKVVSGDNHIAVLIDDGNIVTFGCGENGQLGRISERHLARGGRGGIDSLLKLERVRNIKNNRYCDVWAGSYCTVARTISGQLFGCGLNNYKQLINSDELSILMMTPLVDLNNLNEVFCSIGFGQHHLIGLTKSNRVFVVGRGEYGSLGLGNNENVSTPQEVKIESVNGENHSDILNVYSCNRTSYILMKNGTAYSWGAGDTYMLSHGDDEDVNIPTKMGGKQLLDMKVIQLSPGAQHVVLRAINATVVDKPAAVENEFKLNPINEETKEDNEETNQKIEKDEIPKEADVTNEIIVAKPDTTSGDNDVEMKETDEIAEPQSDV